jgi:hypothetical protein
MNAADNAIERFIAMFGEPRTPNPEKFIEEYQKALRGIDAEVLDKAVDRIMRTVTFWPKPAEVIQEAHRVAAEKYEHRPADWDAIDKDRKEGWKFDDLTRSAVTPESKARVQAMVEEMKRNLAERVVDGKPDPFAPDWERGQREGFEEMQRTSPNKGLHRRHV